MNERIKELAEQAKKYSLDVMIKITDREQALKVYSESYDTKFAELIVRECVSQLYELTPPKISNENHQKLVDTAYMLAVDNGVDKIKQHFGVEE